MLVHTEDIDRRKAGVLLQQGKLVRLAPQWSVDGARWRDAYPRDRFLWSAQALTQKYRNAVITGRAAAVLAGIPLLDYSRSFVFLKPNPQASPHQHITFRKTPPSIVGRAQTHSFAVMNSRGEKEDRAFRLTHPADTVAHIALLDGCEQAVVAADYLLHERVITESEMRSIAQDYRLKRNVRVLQSAVELMSGSSESPRESQLRLGLLALGAGVFCAQPKIYLEDIGAYYRPDFLFVDQLVIVEYDGKSKYEQNPHAAAMADMARQHALVNAGFTVVRINDSMFKNGSWRGVVLRALKTTKRRKPWGAFIYDETTRFDPKVLRKFLKEQKSKL